MLPLRSTELSSKKIELANTSYMPEIIYFTGARLG